MPSRMICPDARLIHYGGASEKVRADKMVRLFNAKRQLFDIFFHQQAARFGRQQRQRAIKQIGQLGALKLDREVILIVR